VIGCENLTCDLQMCCNVFFSEDSYFGCCLTHRMIFPSLVELSSHFDLSFSHRIHGSSRNTYGQQPAPQPHRVEQIGRVRLHLRCYPHPLGLV